MKNELSRVAIKSLAFSRMTLRRIAFSIWTLRRMPFIRMTHKAQLHLAERQ